LRDEEDLAHFLEVYDWVIQEIKSGSS
jgi:hypothetical protein